MGFPFYQSLRLARVRRTLDCNIPPNWLGLYWEVVACVSRWRTCSNSMPLFAPKKVLKPPYNRRFNRFAQPERIDASVSARMLRYRRQRQEAIFDEQHGCHSPREGDVDEKMTAIVRRLWRGSRLTKVCRMTVLKWSKSNEIVVLWLAFS